jgi:hypothetical protein
MYCGVWISLLTSIRPICTGYKSFWLVTILNRNLLVLYYYSSSLQKKKQEGTMCAVLYLRPLLITEFIVYEVSRREIKGYEALAE